MRNKKSPGDEVIFVGVDGYERQAWISGLRGGDPATPMIDVTFTSPGGQPPPQYSTFPATPAGEGDDIEDPKFHPPIPGPGEDKTVPHASERVHNHSYWRGIVDRQSITEEVRRQLKGKGPEAIAAEIEKRVEDERKLEDTLITNKREAAARAPIEAREANEARNREQSPAINGESEAERRTRLHLDPKTGRALKVDPGTNARVPVAKDAAETEEPVERKTKSEAKADEEDGTRSASHKGHGHKHK